MDIHNVIAWVRHGETEWNRLRKIQGQKDIPLNDTGRQQAEAVARRLSAESWDAIYTSDLSRAYETAQIIANHTGLDINPPDIRLRERDFGQEEGTPYGLTNRELLEAASTPGTDSGGIESEQSLRERGLAFVQDVLQDMPGKRLIVVSHGGLIRRILRALTEEETKPIYNCSLTVIRGHTLTEPWPFIHRNCTLHLQQN